jgi:hypothetical protein
MGMRDNEIKELDKDSLANFLKQFKAFLLLSKSESEIAEIIENIQIKFASRFLNTTYLEKRLKGVADVRSLIERVNARISIARQHKARVEMGVTESKPANFIVGPGGFKIRPTQYLDSHLLTEWLLKEKVADTIFGDTAHPEILKRAGPILRYLAN